MIETFEVVLYVLFEALSVVFCLHYLYGEKPHFEIKSACFIIIYVVWMSTGQLFQFKQSWSLIMYPIVALYCWIKFEHDLKTLVINNILYITILSGIQATIVVLFNIVLGVKRVGEIDSIFGNALMLLIVTFLLKKCKLKKLSEVLKSNDKIIIISLSVLIITIFLFLANYKKNISFSGFYYIVLGVSIFLIVIVSIDIGKQKIKTREAEAELRLHKLNEASFQDLIDDICAKQHEFDNHINAIYSQHFSYNTFDELVGAQKQYCAEIIRENQYNKLLSKGNPVIISFLYSKFLDMEKRGIQIDYKINISNLECKVPIYKIVELLGNLIKNAVDAVEKNGIKKVYVMMLEQNTNIKIEVANESEKIDRKKIQDFFKKGYSEKGEKRGYGLYNVKKICEEYDIALTCENCEREEINWLTFGLLINKPL